MRMKLSICDPFVGFIRFGKATPNWQFLVQSQHQRTSHAVETERRRRTDLIDLHGSHSGLILLRHACDTPRGQWGDSPHDLGLVVEYFDRFLKYWWLESLMYS